MDHDEVAGAVEVRMGVDLIGAAVRGPARVPDADRSGDGAGRQPIAQRIEFARVTAHFDAIVLNHGDPGGIIAAIFQPLETLINHGRRISRPDITNNATHETPPVWGMVIGDQGSGIGCVVRPLTGGLTMSVVGRVGMLALPQALRSRPRKHGCL